MNKKANNIKKVSVREFAEKYNTVPNRRGYKMSYGYLYRLIRQKIKNNDTRELWFDFELVGEKDRIYIVLN